MKLKNNLFFWSFILWTFKTFGQAKDSIYHYSPKFLPKNYKDQYQTKAYIYTEQDPGFLEIITQKIGAWLLKLLMRLGANQHSIQNLKLVFYFVVGGIAIYIIAKIFLQKEGQWIFKKSTSSNTLVYDTEVDIIETTNFKNLTETAITKQKYRLATKYFYLWVLQKLAEKEQIELSNLKNNSDYQTELEGSSFFKPFKNISYYYNYVWYGKFEIDEDMFLKISPFFHELLKKIEHEK